MGGLDRYDAVDSNRGMLVEHYKGRVCMCIHSNEV